MVYRIYGHSHGEAPMGIVLLSTHLPSLGADGARRRDTLAHATLLVCIPISYGRWEHGERLHEGRSRVCLKSTYHKNRAVQGENCARHQSAGDMGVRKAEALCPLWASAHT